MTHANRIDEVRQLFALLEPSFKQAWSNDMAALDQGAIEPTYISAWREAQFPNGIKREIDAQYFYSDEVKQGLDRWLTTNESALRALMALGDLSRVEGQLNALDLMSVLQEQTRLIAERLQILAEKLEVSGRA